MGSCPVGFLVGGFTSLLLDQRAQHAMDRGPGLGAQDPVFGEVEPKRPLASFWNSSTPFMSMVELTGMWWTLIIVVWNDLTVIFYEEAI
jgi:hypothetical protein